LAKRGAVAATIMTIRTQSRTTMSRRMGARG